MKLIRKSVSLLKNMKFSTYTCSFTSRDVIDRDHKYLAQNYHPLPVAICRGKGVYLWDVEGNRYWDFLSGYTAVNHGHCHPRLMATMVDQVKTLHHTSRAVHIDALVDFAEMVCKMFNYEKMLPMNTGVEACDTACKIARKWGYRVKKIPQNQAKIVFAEGNFWGRSLAAISSSTDPLSYVEYEPLMPGFQLVPYNNLKSLEKVLSDPDVCAFMVEPIQGEAGVVVPDFGYLKGVRELCTKYNVLWIADEIQTGLGRTGKKLCVDHENVKPDIVCLGKSISGGLYPVSVVLANDPVMSVITPGTHGSTYGGNPLGSKLAIEALTIMEDEKFAENAEKVGRALRKRLESMVGNIVQNPRGKGLMNAFDVNTDAIDPWEFNVRLQKAGFITKLAHTRTIRLVPPLMIMENEMHKAMDVLENVVKSI